MWFILANLSVSPWFISIYLPEASIHMPRIGQQSGSQRSEWYTIERLLRKYASLHGIDIFVYATDFALILLLILNW
jgi:hypothetical protein